MRALALFLCVTAMAAGVAAPAAARPADPPHVEVIGGARAGAGEFPWMVRLNNGCAGTLVRTQYVLTAAHCVGRTGSNSSITVTAGAADLGSRKTFQVRSSQVWRARGFSDVTRGDDWAVIRLSRAVDVPVVALPSGGGLDNGTLTAVGWGATREGSRAQQRYLRKVQVPFIGDASCGKIYRSHGYSFTDSDMICAGDLKRGGKDSCQGDSGGPLLRRDGARWVQVGIISWGVGCGRAAYPGVYTQVSHFAADINAAIEENAARG
ncbi:S1 family serine peptidase [Catellatospora sichuanensis]|uniref:S1 family serine peptidase n=1 Tax=Catellatospora sichuanensis TaxID=1969805 RepID=UPI001183C87B|nr:serine protease [Catellatospora sichuanensis]